MKKVLFIALMAMSSLAVANGIATNPNSGNLPSDPQKGECYLHEWTPPTYSDGSITVVTKDGYTSYNIVPAQFETIQKEVTISDPYAKSHIIPAVWETKIEVVNLVDGAVWTLGKCGDNGEVACYNEEVETESVNVLRLVTDTSAVSENMPAETMTYDYKQLTNPGAITALTADPVTKEITTRIVTSPGEMAWVLDGCASIGIKAVQQALSDAGYEVGPIDGKSGVLTKAAIAKYRADNNLTPGTNIDAELNASLGLK